MFTRSRRCNPLILAGAAVALAALVAAPALGQTASRRNAQPDVLEPPSMGSLKQSDSVLPRMGMAMVIAALVIGVNLIPSKRGHQD